MNLDHDRRKVALGITAFALVGAGGCATTATMSGSGATVTKQGDVVLNDTILALGRPDAEFAKQINNARAVAFFGKANTYLLVVGGERIMGFAQNLDSRKIALLKDSGQLYLKDQTVWGSLRFTYAAPTATDTEKAQLKAAGFNPADAVGNYVAVVSVQGAVYPAANLGSQPLGALHQTRDLAFRAPPTTETKPDLGKIIKLPLALVVDIVTAPLQLLGFVVVMFGLRRMDTR